MADRRYAEELTTLGATYAAWLAWRGGAPRLEFAGSTGAAALVASGGSLAVAELLASIIRSRWGRPAVVTTPVEFAAEPVRVDVAVVVSDSMSHPDAELAVRTALAHGARTVVLTNRPADRIPFATTDVELVVTCPRPGHDGWIATNSVLSLCLGAMTMLGVDAAPPEFRAMQMRWLDSDGLLHGAADPGDRELLCLHAPGLRNVAVDLEARLAESGLGRVTVTDLRGLGHGRHVGVHRNAVRTGVLALTGHSWAPLAEATLATLPPQVDARLWQARGDIWAPIELLLASAGLLGRRAAEAGMDPGNPQVWPGGRDLFRMPVERFLPTSDDASGR